MPARRGMTGIFLAGGQSRRMGVCKTFLPWGDGVLIDHIVRTLRAVADEVLIVAKDPALFAGRDACVVVDRLPETHPAVGLMTGLLAAAHEVSFVCGCDMPWLDPAVIRRLRAALGDADVVVPRGPGGLEPLHAIYRRRCLPRLERRWRAGRRTLQELLDGLSLRIVTPQMIAPRAAWQRSLTNLNTPADYDRIRRSTPVARTPQEVTACRRHGV